MNTVATQRPMTGTDVTPETAKTLRLSPVPLERFDEYLVVARLGQGGMAEVILGLCRGPHGFRKLVAIKRLHAHFEEDQELVRMFMREATLAALLQHPNIVQTHKVGVANGRHFMAMEYLEGQPFYRLIQRVVTGHGTLDPRLAVRVVCDALLALHFVHEALDYDGTPMGIVHRDVSPQNLFVTFDGQVKLLDFGIAKAEAFGDYTRPGLIKGKLSYIAPEQARGQRVDRRADIWSVGVTLWEALVGRRLFRADDEVGVVRALLRDEIPRVDRERPELSSGLADIVERALQRDCDRRYATALDMKEALDAWLAEQGPDETRDTLSLTMHTLFADTLCNRRELIRECLTGAQSAGLMTLPGVADASPPPPPVLTQATSSKASFWRKGLGVAALASLGVLAVSLWFERPLEEASPTQSGMHAVAEAREAPMAAGTPAAPRAKSEPSEERSAVAAPRSAVAAPRSAVAAPRSAVAEPRSALAAKPNEASSSSAPAAHHHRRHALETRSEAQEHPSDTKNAASPAPNNVSATNAERGSNEESAPGPRDNRERVRTGRLRLEASPYAVVSLGDQKLGITPIDVELPVAAHTLTLRNPERGIETTYLVQIVEAESIYRRIELE